MLAAIGVASREELLERQIPREVRLGRELALPAGKPEQEVYEHLCALAQRNWSSEQELSFLGAGMYDHYVPAVIDMLTSRSEFLTPYTPYQPEVAQGTLQVMFEYQTAISELTALAVSNASVYEGPSAVASAAYMAKLHNGRRRIVVSAGLHPHSIQTLRTYAHGFGMEVHEVALRGGVTDPRAMGGGARAADERGDLRAAELLRRGRGRGRLERGGEASGRRGRRRGRGRGDLAGRSDHAGDPRPAG